jgi:hypothetical protein
MPDTVAGGLEDTRQAAMAQRRWIVPHGMRQWLARTWYRTGIAASGKILTLQIAGRSEWSETPFR